MNQLMVLAGRELSAMFRTPVGWIVIALYLFLTALVFATNTLIPGQPATMRYFFSTSALLLIPIAPAVSMRLFSEEYRSGTIEILGTTALGPWTLATGKLLGSIGFLLLMLAPTLIFPILLMVLSDPIPDPGPIITGYLGLVLVGTVYLSIGQLASALTTSQTLAFLATLMLLVLLSLASTQLPARVPPPFDLALLELSIDRRVRDFSIGILDTAHIVFFISTIALFVTLSASALAMRRWR
jgi:gliding motility-associated transport system permease protein